MADNSCNAMKRGLEKIKIFSIKIFKKWTIFFFIKFLRIFLRVINLKSSQKKE